MPRTQDDDGRGGRAPTARVLVLAGQPDLRADLADLCAQAGAGLDAPDLAGPDRLVDGLPLPVWTAAPLVLLDAGAVALVRHLPRRDGVVLVHAGPGRPGARDGVGVAGPGSPPAVTGEGGDDPGPDVWRAAVAVGAEHVAVLPAAREWLVAAVARACRPRGRCVAVIGARGGAGATSAALALALAGARAGRRVLAVDADPVGGGLDLAVGAEDLPGLRWADLHDVRAPLPPGGLGASLPVADGVVLLSYGRDPVPVDAQAARAVLAAGVDEHDLVVVDLPRSADPAADVLAQAADHVVCVVPSEVRACAAAPAVLARLPVATPLHLLVRGPAPGGLRPSDAAAAVRAGLGDRRLAGVDRIRSEPRLAAALERGEPFAVSAGSPLRRWARGWLTAHVPDGRREPAGASSGAA